MNDNITVNASKIEVKEITSKDSIFKNEIKNDSNNILKNPIFKKIDVNNFRNKTAFNKEKIKRGPYWTAYNRENVSSIPTKNEYLLVKNQGDVVRGFSSQTIRFKNEGSNITPGPGSYMSKEINNSFNSKGLGNGFISQTERFDYSFIYQSGYVPGPSDYNNLPHYISNNQNDVFAILDKKMKSKNLRNNSNRSFSTNYSNSNNNLDQTNLSKNSIKYKDNKNKIIIPTISTDVKIDKHKSNKNDSNSKNYVLNDEINEDNKNNLKIKGKTINKTKRDLNSFLKKSIHNNADYDPAKCKISNSKVMVDYSRSKQPRFFNNKIITNEKQYLLKAVESNVILNNEKTVDHQELLSANTTNSHFYKKGIESMKETSSTFKNLVTMDETAKTTKNVFHSKIINDLEKNEEKDEHKIKFVMNNKIKYNILNRENVIFDRLNKEIPRTDYNIVREFDKSNGKVFSNFEPSSVFMSKTIRNKVVKDIIPGPAFYSPSKLNKTSYNVNIGKWI